MLVVDRLSKTYPSFSLQNVSFEVPAGFITGFIGVNGAGKTTTLKSIMNIVRPDAGTVTFEGENLHTHEADAKQRIGFMLGPVDFYPKHSVRSVVDVYRRFYDHWDHQTFQSLLNRFAIDERKKISELSTGMRVKLGISMALSYGAKLFLLDEPTSGLDPVARDELLDFFQELVEDGEHGVLFSTHITSDLDKCADYLIMLRDGQIVANDTKDDLLMNHVMVKGGTQQLTDGLRQKMIAHKTNAFGFTGLARRDELAWLNESEALQTETPDLESLLLYYDLEEAR